MKQPKNSEDLENKLDTETWNKYFSDVRKIYRAQDRYFELQRQLYDKIWPLDYSAVPKALLARYQAVLNKLGSLNKKSLKQFIKDEFSRLDELKEKINSWESIADTLEFYSKEKGFISHKQRSEVYRILSFATWYPTKHILSLWKLLDDKDGYSMSPKEIMGIIKCYKKGLRKSK